MTSYHRDTTSVFLRRDTNQTQTSALEVILAPSHWGRLFFFFSSFQSLLQRGTAVFTVLYSESRRVTWKTLRAAGVSFNKNLQKKVREKKKSHKNTGERKPVVQLKCFVAAPVQGYVQVVFFFLLFTLIRRWKENNCNGVFCAYESQWPVCLNRLSLRHFHIRSLPV